MRKIANTDELQTELRQLLAYAKSERPSRTRIASQLSTLSVRLGGKIAAAAPSKAAVKSWMTKYMKSGDGDHLIDRKTNEVNTTLLAENAAHEFDHDEWLDDETHFVWDVALEVGGKVEKDL